MSIATLHDQPERTADAWPQRLSRRNLVGDTLSFSDTRSVWGKLAGLFGILAAAGAFCLTRGLDTNALATGIADAAFVAACAAAVCLALVWRMVGDALSRALTSAVVFFGLIYIPAMCNHSRFAPPLRTAAVGAVVILVLSAVRSPEVKGHPLRILAIALGFATSAALLLTASPARLLEDRVDGIRVAGLCSSAVSVALAVACALVARRRGRLLLVGVVMTTSAMAAASALRAVVPRGSWPALIPLALLVGALELLVVAGSELQAALQAMVREVVRGSLRSETAERHLAEVLSAQQGQYHDAHSLLSAIDCSLFVLATQRRRLGDFQVDRLLASIRDEVRWLQSLVEGDDGDLQFFDVAELLHATLSVRSLGSGEVLSDIERGLVRQGYPVRLAVVFDNLLANAHIHAPGARVVVEARRNRAPPNDVIEIAISDDGPGLEESELELAFDRGWRSAASLATAGSGIGLAQCRELVTAEGGEIALEATHPDAPPGSRGLTVRMRFPSQPTGLPALSVASSAAMEPTGSSGD